ncbi:hypothetical protein ABIB25_004254 [Nakamurella sp. UYEF19]|uniref:DUF4386 domain-containing protein n=1 Tax=Nakamurella sp. UYEF19 TaxID=1756392 RepID=UPI0033937846
MTTPQPDLSARSSGGPPLPVPAIAFAVLTVLAVVVSIKVPTPSAAAQTVLTYQAGHGTTLRLAGSLQFAAALPLAIWAATVHGRLRALGVTAAGNTMALAGGILAAASLALGGLITWTSAETAHLGDAVVARVLADLAFGTGAAGFVVPFALLIAGVAVPALIMKLTPRPLAIAGLVLAAVGMTATATLLTATLDATLPVVRFGGLIWIILASIALSRPRRAVGV